MARVKDTGEGWQAPNSLPDAARGKPLRLTPKQEGFCLAYLETGNASEAYRRVYDAGRMKPKSIHRKAFGLLEQVKITARLKELRPPAVGAAQVNP